MHSKTRSYSKSSKAEQEKNQSESPSQTFKYQLEILPSAQKEWSKLNPDTRERFKKKLAERLNSPHVEKDKLSGMQDCYKIKLRNPDFRLVYRVFEDRVTLQLVAVGKRERGVAYTVARKRIKK